MLFHIIKVFIRDFRRHLGLNLLNLLGLAAAMAACMMIIIYLNHEYTYDDFHEHGDRIVRVNTFQKVGEGQEIRLPSASYPVAEGLAAEIPAVEEFTRFRFSSGSRPVFVGDRTFYENDIAWADSTIFRVFSYRLLRGNPDGALSAAGSVVISESTARKYFGDQDPMGREIKFGEKSSYSVTGIMEDITSPSHLPPFTMLMSLSTRKIPWSMYWVGRSFYGSYLLLSNGYTAESVQQAADRVYLSHAERLLKNMGAECSITLQPLNDIHFDNGFDFDLAYTPAVTREKISIFSLIALIILITACVNFINMSTSRATERSHSVGMRKVLGASRRELVIQFLGESVLTALAALVVAFALVELLLPFFGGIVGREFLLPGNNLLFLIVLFLLLTAVIGIGAGLYPSLVLSSFRPAATIRARFISGSSRSTMRRLLLGFQFTVAILLIIITLNINNQLDYMNSRNPGYDTGNLMVLNVAPDMTADDCSLLRKSSLNHSGVLSGTCSSYLPTMGHMEYTFEVTEDAACDMLMTMMFTVDPWFIETIGMEIKDGRDFHRDGTGDFGKSVIINAEAARQLGWDNPVGRQIDSNPAKGGYKPLTIIGVVKDINFESYHREIQPMTLVLNERTPSRIAFRLREGMEDQAIEHIRTLWKGKFPSSQFRYSFLDENFAGMYGDDIRLGNLFTFYTLLAVVISCVGLLALVSFSTERRIREIGIRKVLGAGHPSLFVLLFGEYTRVVIISLIVAAPIAFWATRRWLENFAYRASIDWWIYPAAGIAALALAIITAGAYIWRACRINPADVLRQE